MKVKNILSECSPVWLPGRDYGKSKPQLSMLLPTFRRAQDGLFRRVVHSILSQSFDDLELIIVDDASTDGTACIIDRFMREDGRVSCIRHTRNIGLPAISEFEALQKATGSVIGFAFDDFVYEPDALGIMMAAMALHRCDSIHGEARMQASGHDVILGENAASHDRLLYHNFIPNGAVFVSRNVIDAVGFYDPHIVMSRLCDWDLWLRIQKSFSFDSVPILVGREHGASRSDSLGNTYPLQFELVREFMGEARNSALTSHSFMERDVLAVPSHASYSLKKYTIELYDFFASRSWFPAELKKAPSIAVENHKSRRTIAVVGWLTASVSLYWICDADSYLDSVVFIDPEAPASFANPAIINADLVVFAREIFSPGQQAMLRFCRGLKIPHIYFVDDNLPVLAQDEPAWAAYNLRALQNELSSFQGVVVSSAKLESDFRKLNLHRKVDRVTPIFNQELLQKLRRAKDRHLQKGDRLVVGFFGGSFRVQSLVNVVRPALDASPAPTCLITRPVPIDFSSKTVSHHTAMESPYFFEFLDGWAKYGIDAIAHPSGRTSNIDFKSENVILVSFYLGAVPIVTEEAAYSDFGREHGVEKIEDSIAAWQDAFERLRNPSYRAEMLKKLEQTCRDRFSKISMEGLLESYSASLPTLEPEILERRYRKALHGTQYSPPIKHGVDADGICILNVVSSMVKPESSLATSQLERGNLEEVINGRIVKGWAYSSSSTSSTMTLEVDGFQVGTFSACLYRDDLMQSGIGCGEHAFVVAVPEIFCDGMSHSIDVKFLNSGNSLSSPISAILLKR